MTLSAQPPRRSWLLRTAIIVGHRVAPYGHLIVLAIGISIASNLWVADPGWPLAAARTVVALILGAGYVCQLVHDRNVCDRDELPFLDPGAAVEEHLNNLRLYHRRGLGLILALALLASAFTPMHHHWPLGLRLVLTAAIGGLAVANAWRDHAVHVHGKLHLWCPWCPRYRGEGDDETAPVPQPQPTGSVGR